MYTEPGIEATACARELLYVYVYVMRISRSLDIPSKLVIDFYANFGRGKWVCRWIIVRFLFLLEMAGSWKKIRGALKLENVQSVIFNPENSLLLMVILFVIEVFINVWVIKTVRCKFGRRASDIDIKTKVLILIRMMTHFWSLVLEPL